VFLKLHTHGVVANEVFWGLWLFPLGVLIWRSGFLPRFLAVLLFANGLAYLAQAYFGVMAPELSGKVGDLLFPALMGEVVVMLWLLVMGARRPAAAAPAVALLKIGIGGGTLFNGREAAVNADGIALASFGTAGADAFVSLFAAWGLSQLALGAVNLVVLVRYRALVPFMFVLLLIEHLLRKLIFVVLPIPRIASQTPGLAINLVIVALMGVGLVLALREREAA
jgi:hypothetical protein